MPGKVVYFLCIVLAFAVFSISNLNNSCNVSFIFYTFKDMPVYLHTLFSFVVGCIITLPFFIRTKKKKEKIAAVSTESEASGIKNVALKERKKFRFWHKKKETEPETPPVSS